MSSVSHSHSHTHGHAKSARLESRCTQEQKNRVQRAATLLGVSITSFTIITLMEKAEKIIRDQGVITLSLQDQHAFAKALSEAPTLNKNLVKAKKRHQKEIKSAKANS